MTVPKLSTKHPKFQQLSSMSLADVHSLLISTLTEEFGDNIRIFSNQAAKALPYTSTQKYITDPNKYFPRLFTAYATKHNSDTPIPTSSIQTHRLQNYEKIIVHKINTSIPFSTIIRHPEITNLMNTYKIHLTNYAWNEDKISISSLGWLLNIHPLYQKQENAQESLREQIKTKLGSQTKIPKFKLVFSKPSITRWQKFPFYKSLFNSGPIERQRQNDPPSHQNLFSIKHFYILSNEIASGKF